MRGEPIPVGSRFGRLVTTDNDLRMYRKLASRCVCDCGAVRVLPDRALRSGNTSSCGCFQRERKAEVARAQSLRHGNASRGHWSAAYTSWAGMIQRCTNPNNPQFDYYGGRGIKVCDRWLGFAAFLEDMGDRPTGLTLDRIDVNGNYEKSNCRWADWHTQRVNQRRMKAAA